MPVHNPGGGGGGDTSSLVTLNPATSARNTIQPGGAAVVPLIVKGAASQSAKLQEWQTSDGATRMFAGAAGELYASMGNTNGYIASDGAIYAGNSGANKISLNDAAQVGSIVLNAAGKGLIVKSPDGLVTRRIGIANDGTLSLTAP